MGTLFDTQNQTYKKFLFKLTPCTRLVCGLWSAVCGKAVTQIIVLLRLDLTFFCVREASLPLFLYGRPAVYGQCFLWGSVLNLLAGGDSALDQGTVIYVPMPIYVLLYADVAPGSRYLEMDN